jgi:uncharacterized protein YndB with AHSA1/START domain
MTENPVAQVSRHIMAPPERVFAGFTDPEIVRAWMSTAGPDEQFVSATTEPRVGGRFSFVLRRGGMLLDHNGEYLQVTHPALLSFTWSVNEAWDGVSTVTARLAPSSGGTDVTLTHEMAEQWREFVPQGETAWGLILDRLAAAVVARK